MPRRMSPHGIGSLVTLLASACQLVPNPALLGGDASTGVDAASSSSSAGMDGVGTTGPAGSSTTGSLGSTSTGSLGSTSTDPVDSSSTGDCMGDGSGSHSYIWISNSTESTISKINTETLVEVGRYITRPDSNGNPSRTSVSLTGNVAVANRSGGLTKIHADPADCRGGSTSSGPGDVKAWGDEDCLAWHTPMVYMSQRPVAWTQGVFDEASCSIIDEKVWTSGSPDGSAIEVLLVDGDTGTIEATVPIPGVAANYYGIYGAAVDSEGNFWGSQLDMGQLVRVALADLSVSTWPMATGGYGMTVDSLGKVWTCRSDVGRFDPLTETWQTALAGGNGGCMEDGMGTLWLANDPMVGVDIETMAVTQTIDVPEYVHGISIDYQGYVWGVGMSSNAYRVDPRSGTWDPVGGLVSPYTYSDMTGFALSSVSGSSGTP